MNILTLMNIYIDINEYIANCMVMLLFCMINIYAINTMFMINLSKSSQDELGQPLGWLF